MFIRICFDEPSIIEVCYNEQVGNVQKLWQKSFCLNFFGLKLWDRGWWTSWHLKFQRCVAEPSKMVNAISKVFNQNR